MANGLDRALQRRILDRLLEHYPVEAGPEIVDCDAADPKWVFNVTYLAEHELVEAKVTRLIGAPPHVLCAKITARGIDFLEDDGGLSAMLGVMTVRIHDDTIKTLIERKILASDLPAPDKQRLRDQLRSLPAEATKHMVLKLMEMALENSSRALPLLETFFR